MRRNKYEITDRDEMIRIMAEANVGRMATIDADGYPYITPVNFVFHEGAVYFHCALEGEKLDNIDRDPRVCFEVDIPLAYLEVAFNEKNSPCNTHQLFHCVVMRGKARVLPDGPLKVAALNALVAKHEGNEDFDQVSEDMPAYKICKVVEIIPESMTGKSDLAQTKPKDGERKDIAEKLVRRGHAVDLETVRAMGYELEGDDNKGLRVK